MVEKPLVVRRASFLECQPAQTSVAGERYVLVTLGNEDGSIDQLGLDFDDGRRLLHRLAIALRIETLPPGPANHEKVLRKFLVPHAILRSELNVDHDLVKALHQLKLEIPEVGQFVERSLESLRLSLRRASHPQPRLDRVLKRITRFVLVAVDAARIDT